MADRKTDPVAALRDFDRTIALDPTNTEAYYQRGLIHSFMISNEDARDDMQTAARMGHTEALKWLAPYEEKRIKEIEATSAKTEAVPDVEAAQEASTAEPNEKSVEKGSKAPGLGEYLSSKSEPVIYFDHNRSDIKPQYNDLLDEIAGVLKEKISQAKITLAGHTDSTGGERYNASLSVRRARAVELYLRDNQEIPAERVTVKAYGQNSPIASNETEEGRAKNRRVEVILDASK